MVNMKVLVHDTQKLEKWRDGVMTRMHMSALLDGRQLCIFEQFCDPGLGAPTHIHAVEEVLEVIDGTAEIWLEDEKAVVTANQDRKSTRLNSSHVKISYAVFCLKKKSEMLDLA